MSQSSRPNAFTILIRTKTLSEYARAAVATKAMFTPRSSGPRFGIDILVFVGSSQRVEFGKPQDQESAYTREALYSYV
jgi:hypothetical protein